MNGNVIIKDATPEEMEAARKYAEDYGRFLGIKNPKDLKGLEDRYLNGLEEFADDIRDNAKMNK